MIQILEDELSEAKAALGLSDNNFEKFYEQEVAYFRDMEGPNPTSELKRQYVKALNNAGHWQYVYFIFPNLVSLQNGQVQI